jgi:5-methylcytosine-specific restriction endonuclease McrA
MYKAKTCVECGHSFQPGGSRAKRCESCRYGNCRACGQRFLRQYPAKMIFCSIGCYTQTRWPDNRAEVTCMVCGVVFQTNSSERRKTCSRLCYRAYRSRSMRGADNPEWRGGHRYYRGPNWFTQRAKARKRAKYTCQDCGAIEADLGRALDVDHIKPFTAFNSYKRANQLSNLRALCHACHARRSTEQAVIPRFLPLRT